MEEDYRNSQTHNVTFEEFHKYDINENVGFVFVKEDYDAMLVYMYRSSDISEDGLFNNESMYYKLYGWDVDTLLVLNPNVIEVV